MDKSISIYLLAINAYQSTCIYTFVREYCYLFILWSSLISDCLEHISAYSALFLLPMRQHTKKKNHWNDFLWLNMKPKTLATVLHVLLYHLCLASTWDFLPLFFTHNPCVFFLFFLSHIVLDAFSDSDLLPCPL